jgi:RTX calcium-binding nonapeptide repeat (4 copies)
MAGKRAVALAVAVGALVVAFAVPRADAATISLRLTTGPAGGESYMRYDGSPGESNRAVVRWNRSFSTITVVDRGAHRIRTRRGCRVISRISASCRPGLSQFSLHLGDRNDRVNLRRTGDPRLCGDPKPPTTAGAMRRFLTVEPGENEEPFIGFNYPDTFIDLGTGDDRLTGSCGAEAIRDGDGADVVHAGAGSDAVDAAPDTATDVFDLGGGLDAIGYRSDASGTIENEVPVAIDLGAGTAGPMTGGTTDSVRAAEVAVGGGGPDQLTGGPTVEGFVGGGGDDRIESGRGPDFVACGDGNDVAVHDPADLTDSCEAS